MNWIQSLLVAPLVLVAQSNAVANDDSSCMRCGPLQTIYNEQPGDANLEALQKYFAEHVGAGRITHCNITLSEGYGESSTAVAGACIITISGKRSKWSICGDDGIGHFAATTGLAVPEPDAEALATFMKANCIGG